MPPATTAQLLARLEKAERLANHTPDTPEGQAARRAADGLKQKLKAMGVKIDTEVRAPSAPQRYVKLEGAWQLPLLVDAARTSGCRLYHVAMTTYVVTGTSDAEVQRAHEAYVRAVAEVETLVTRLLPRDAPASSRGLALLCTAQARLAFSRPPSTLRANPLGEDDNDPDELVEASERQREAFVQQAHLVAERRLREGT